MIQNIVKYIVHDNKNILLLIIFFFYVIIFLFFYFLFEMGNNPRFPRGEIWALLFKGMMSGVFLHIPAYEREICHKPRGNASQIWSGCKQTLNRFLQNLHLWKDLFHPTALIIQTMLTKLHFVIEKQFVIQKQNIYIWTLEYKLSWFRISSIINMFHI